MMNAYIEKNKKTGKVQIVYGDNALEKSIRLLINDRIDAVIEAEPVFWHTASKAGIKNKVKIAGQVAKSEKCYIAFSPAISESGKYAKILSDGVNMLRQSEELGEILEKYGLEDWKK